MRVLEADALKEVGGGLSLFVNNGYGTSGDAAQSMLGATVVADYGTTATYADAAAARAEYASAQQAAGYLSAAAGIGATAVVTGACIAVPSLLSGPAALETASLLARPCAYLGGMAGTATGIWVSGLLKRGIE